MDITKEKKDELNAELKIKVGPEDYQESVTKALKDYRKKANIPGFRPGKVPMSMVKKMAGKNALVEEINKVISESLNKYITENELDVLGNPLPKEESDKVIDWDKQEEFEFTFELGLAPDFDLKLDDKVKVKKYKIQIDEKLVDKYVNDAAKRYGKMTNPEDDIREDDLLYGKFEELNDKGEVKEEGVSNESTVAVDRVPDKKLKKKFMGMKPGDAIELDMKKLSENETDLAATLNVDKDTLQEVSPKLRFSLQKINRLIPAAVDQALFDKIYGEGVVDGKKDFREKIKSELELNLEKDGDYRLMRDMQEELIDKHKLDLPDEFLKRWLLTANENPVTPEQIEKEYDDYAKSLKWQLIQNKVIKEFDIKVEQEEIMDYTKGLIRQQFINMGQTEVADEQLAQTAIQVLQNQEEGQKIYQQLYNEKVFEIAKEKVKIKEKEISYDDFLKLAQEQ